jgi:hypothetical protein
MWLWLVVVSLAFVAFLALIEKISELIRLLRRIESRLTLHWPLDEEEELLSEPLDIRFDILKRALHPDTWSNRWLRIQELGLYKDDPKRYWKDRKQDNKEYRGQ